MKVKNVFFSSVGVILPAFIFLVSTPIIIDKFGIDRFGYISLFWVFLSVSSILDLGMARALTNFVAKNLNKKEELDSIYSVLLLLAIFSFLICFLLYLVTIYVIPNLGHIPSYLIDELSQATVYIALAVPSVILYSALRGIFEGEANFKLTSYSKMLMGICMVVPLVFVSEASATLLYAAQVCLITRLIGFFILLSNYLIKFRPKEYTFNLKGWEIFIFGAKVSVSSLSSSVLVYSDRFIASALLSPKDFGVYSLCTELVMRFLFIPGAISAVSFQSLSQSLVPSKTKAILGKGIKYMSISILPISLILFLFGNELIYLWSSVIIAGELNYVILILSIGLLINSYGHLSYAYLQAGKFLGFTAKLHVFELIFFIPIMFFMCMYFGVVGLLLSWLGRITFDFIVMTIKVLK